ncbi:hypothetical protein [Thalassomonas haliotis]|uniref:Lipoprotein n=1 Tax=Thalassomonas haliotis TaxID=485448 RepID=A0ABY7VAG1_9GAMM|nr:hypothetical protein [Thalassomonas haliotis]WDE10637.1 hypothetical protein H3N35_20615 [Thalassomonas haliotis]
MVKLYIVVFISILLVAGCASTQNNLTESSSCWQHNTSEYRGQSDHLKLCLKNGLASLEVEHFNSINDSQSTICGQGGEVIHMTGIYYNIYLNDGGCENGRHMSRSTLSCQIQNSELICLETIKNYKVKFKRKNA